MPTKLVHTNGYYGEDTGKHPVWVEAQEQPFIITLTPTDEALAGTMDKTPAEIWEAYKAGYRFEFFIPELQNARVPVSQTMEYTAQGYEEPTGVILASAVIFNPEHDMTYFLIQIVTSTTDPTYGTNIFTLKRPE